MEASFAPAPHKEAAALIAGKTPVTRKVFNGLLPELRARAFLVSGISSMDALQRIQSAVTAVPMGDQTWNDSKKQIVDELEPYLGDGADYRAELVLRVNGFQAFSSSIHAAAMADEDTTHLQYLHGECKVPTPSHLALNGLVLPKDDPFWQTHTGPWGHLGCMCYVRPMNPDLVDDERKKDEKRNPEDRNVITGPALKQLHHGDILRGGVHYDVNYDGPDNSGFKWSPGDFKIPVKDLEAKYDPEVWSEFQEWAQRTMLSDQQSVWDWLSEAGPAPQLSLAKSEPEKPVPVAPAPKLPKAFAAVLKKFNAAGMSYPVMRKVARLPKAVAPLLDNLNVRETTGGAYYTPGTKTMFVQRNPKKWSGLPDTVVHEIGHHLHYQTGTITDAMVDPKFAAAAAADWQKFADWAKTKIGTNWRTQMRRGPGAVMAVARALKYTGDYGDLPLAAQKRITRFTDTILGLSNGQYGYGHAKAYMLENGLKEVFTHAWTGLVDSDKEFARLFSGVTEEVRRVLNL